MLNPIKSTYKDYVIEQRALSSNQEMIDYWRAELSDYRKYEFPEQPKLNKVTQSNTSIKTLSSDRYIDLQRAAQQQKVTVKSICLAAYISTLYMFSYENDILIGIVENGRPISQDGGRMLGCFLNTVPLRTIFQSGMSWGDIVQHVHIKQNELKKYGRLSLVQIQKAVEEQSSMENPFFDTAFNFIDFHVYETLNEGLFEFMPFSFERTNTLLDFSVSVTLGELSVKMVSLYDKPFTDRLFEVYLRIMDCMISETDSTLDTANILTIEEKEKLQRFNDTTAAYPRNDSIVSLFKQQVSKYPDHPALIMGEEQLTYKELDDRIETAASALLERGVRSGETVGMLTERSIEMVISIFAILRTGGIYIPLDPAHPDERISSILTDSKTSWLIADNERLIKGYHGKVLSIQDDLNKVSEITKVLISASSISAESPAYIMYTSGSTGKPKGVVTTHRNIVKTSVNNGFMDVTESDRILQLSNYAFDGSTYEIFGALLNGASLVLISRQQLLNVQELAKTMLTHQITSCFMTAALFNTLVDWDVHSLRHVRKLFFGGEAASKKHVARALEVLGEHRLVNGYGPTETTVFAATYSVDERLFQYDSVPIGKPIHNTRAYIVNQAGQLQLVGVPGELCVTGDGLAEGYLGQQDLTDERFVPCPFEPGQRMYRTGDLVCWLPNGVLEYRGRIDQQVKIRGNRVELTEIQGKLVEMDSIKEAVVTAQRDQHGHSYLCAYVVPAGTDSSMQMWKKELRQTLPEYMIPSTFITVSALPVTSNGKLDRKALPAPEKLENVSFAAPTNELEEKLISLWEEILQVQRIGIDEHFFEIGGHSLKAMMLAAKIQKSFEIKISLQDIFRFPTIREMAEWMLSKQKSELLKIQPAAIQDIYPASSIQKRLYIVQQFENAETSYNMPIIVDLKGRLIIEKLEDSLLALIQRHEVLRTSFELQDGELCQRIHQVQDLDPFVLQHEVLLEHESFDEAVKRYTSQFILPFDLGQASLFRAGLITLTDDHHMLLIDMHHIISDGMSIHILLKDLIALYENQQLPELRIQYKDFAVWESEMDEKGYDSSERYWLSKFKHEPAVIELPTDYVRPVHRSFKGGRLHFEMPDELACKLRQISAARHDTLFMMMMAAFQVLLAKYSGEDDIVVGTPFSLRGEVGEEGLTGMFANTLAIRTTPESGLLVREYLDSVHKQILSSFEHGMYPLQKLINRLSLSTDHSRHPLFETMFVVQEQEKEQLANTELTVDYAEWDQGTSKFDMTWICSASEQGMNLGIEYRTDLWSAETIHRTAHHYFHILNQLLQFPDLRIGDVELLTSTEAEQLDAWNKTSVDYPVHLSIAELFEQQSRNRSEADALIMGRSRMSYRELNEAANRLAWYISHKGLLPGERVGLLMDRSMDMIVSILAVIKAGGVYVPLDPTFPEDRIRFMLNDSQAELVIASAGYEVSGYEGQIVHYNEALWSGESSTNLMNDYQIEPAQPLYIMYTSGSTGTPKGVMATHRNVIKTILNNGYLQIEASDRFLQASNYAFDGSTFDIFGALLHGASLVLIERTEMLHAAALADMISSQQITVLFLTTALFNTLIDFDSSCFLGTRKVLFGGEKVSVNHVGRALDILGEGRLIHMYGPTEATVFSTFHEISSASHVPIGRPTNNTLIYVLNKSGKRQPIGVPGELYIGGDGVALAYLGRPELTTERFVVHPQLSSSRLYKTGDCVKLLSDGRLEFVERIDLQVKIRGHRIELGEIEARIRMLEGVQETVVVASTDEQGHSYLGAYIVPEDKRMLAKKQTPLTIAGWKKELKTCLPDYMIPTVFMLLEELPLTSNGKVNRRVLPRLEIKQGDHYAPATNETQKVLVSLWEEVLGISRIGIHDHFFEIGGHSLKAMMLVGKIHQKFNVKMSLSDIFQMPILADMSAWIQQSDLQPHMAIQSGPEQSEYPLTDIQKQIYYADQHEEAVLSYNMPMLFELTGIVDIARLEASFVRIIGRHEALRTSIHLESGQFSQRICDMSKLDWQISRSVMEDIPEEVDVPDYVNNWMNGFVKPFQLDHAPLLRVSLLTVHPKLHYLALDTHHIISDGVSTALIYDELMTLYQGLPLKPVRVQYKDYAVWKNERIKDKAYEESEQFWLAEFSDFDATAELPMDHQRPAVKSTQGSIYRFELKEELYQLLQQEAAKYSTTHFTLLFAAYSNLLARYSGEEDIVVGTPIAGRNHVDTQQTIGMFVNTLPLRIRPDSEKTAGEFITNLKQYILDAFEHGEYSLSSLTEKLNLPFSPSRNPMFDTLFVLQDMRLNQTVMPDLNIRPLKWRGQQAKFDMTWAWQEEEGRMIAEVEYRPDLWNEDSIERMAVHYERLLYGMLIHRDTKLKDLEMLSQAEYDQFKQWNQTESLYPNAVTLTDLFELRVKEQPEHTALQYQEIQITYKELNERVIRMASYLWRQGIRPGSYVGLLAERKPEMIVSILAILKVGAAYVPLDPRYPEERLRFMLEDSGAKWLISEEGRSISQYVGMVIPLWEPEVYAENSFISTRSYATPTDPAYVMYTSGSTGRPKGVITTHKGIVNICCHNGYVELGPQDRMLQLSNYAFDGSTFDIFGALLNGAALLLMPSSMLQDVSVLSSTIRNEGITVQFMTTALFNTLVDYDMDSLAGLRKIIIGGEAASYQHVSKVLDFMGEHKLINAYGPTETTVIASMYPVDHDVKNTKHIPIGRPVRNTRFYVMNENCKLQPVGIPGELYIAGDGLAEGYLGQPELTSSKFYDFHGNERMYRTGDIVKWLPNGELVYISRADGQLKIRGNRIESGEVENAIIALSNVNESVVVGHRDKNGTSVLVAYVVCDSQAQSSEDKLMMEWRQELRATLPEYMIPSLFILLESLPLTHNGKVDRRALPEPTMTGSSYVEPITDIEIELVQLWSELLGIERIGASDSFFLLGGHSLKVMMLAARIYERWEVKIALPELFNAETLAEMGRLIERGSRQKYAPIPKAVEQASYPVSSAQKRLYLVEQFEDTNSSYNMPIAMKLKGTLVIERLELALRKLIHRHESLRTSYGMEDGEVRQRIHSIHEIEFELIRGENTLGLPLNDFIESSLEAFIRPFDLSYAPLVRAGLYHLSNEEYLLLMDTHHIASDGITTGILYRDLIALYEGHELKVMSAQFKDYASWQTQRRMEPDYSASEQYWVNKFEEPPAVIDILTEGRRPVRRQFDGAVHSFELDSNLYEQLKELSIRTNSTMFMVLLAGYKLLLSKYTAERDIVVGTPVAGRYHSDTASIAGMFVNTIALRNRVEGHYRVEEWIRLIRKETLQAFEYGEYPLDELIEKLGMNRDPGRNPLFDTMFVLQDARPERAHLGQLDIEPLEWATRTAKFDMTWAVNDHGGLLSMTVEYSKGLYQEEQINRMAQHFVHILNQMTSQPHGQLEQLQLITAAEEKQIHEYFNNTAALYPRSKNIVELFEEQVSLRPNHTAVQFNQESLTYSELNRLTRQFAGILIKKGLRPGTAVGLRSERSIEMIVGILGILRAGGAYVPIDPSYPEERAAYMLKNSGAIILAAPYGTSIDGFNGVYAPLEPLHWGLTEAMDGQSVPIHPEMPAYMMYTSGSTGEPKGVVTTHQNVVKTSINNGFIDLQPEDRILQLSNYAFDGSTFEIFGSLLNGSTLVVIRKEDVLDIARLAEIIEKEHIASFFITTTLFNALVDYDVTSLKHTKRVFVGGEATSKPHMMRAFEYLGANRIANGYGPTETTVFATTYNVDETLKSMHSVPIGRPIHNTRAYVISEEGHLQPIGIAGELYIAGEGLAQEYLGEPEMTHSRFTSVSSLNEPRLYRSGDKVKWLPDGSLEFISRIDQQVKIRGHRIEPGEIETRLMEHSLVTKAVVIARKADTGHYLCAYLVNSEDISTQEIRRFLQERLPDYMIPSYFIFIADLPLTRNGKLDHRALPDPELSLIQESYIAPQTEEEKVLAEVWSEVLGVAQMGVDDNFFTLGGDSIKSIQIVSKLAKRKWKLQVKHLMLYPTIADCALYLERTEIKKATSQQSVGEIPLTPIQSWFFEQNMDDEGHFNQSMMLYNARGWNEQVLHDSFVQLIAEHDALRIRFITEEDAAKQMVCPLDEGPFYTLDMYELDEDTEEQTAQIEYLATAIQSQMDITSMLCKLGIFKTEQGDHLLIAIHHLIIDGVSWRILIEDLMQIYNAMLAGEETPILSKTDTYFEWSHRLTAEAAAGAYQREASYWKGIEKRASSLPNSKQSPCTYKDSVALSMELDTTVTQQLLTEVHRAYHTDVNDLLLSALALTYETETLIHLEGHGREELVEQTDLSRTIGWFTSIYPVILTPSQDWGDTLRNIKEMLRSIPNKGAGYGVLKYLTSELDESVNASDSDIVFNYLGQFENHENNQAELFSAMPMGELISPLNRMAHHEEWNCVISEGLFKLTYRYNPEVIGENMASLRLEQFKSHLKSLIHHCIDREEEYTPSDYTDSDLTFDELDDIEDIIKGL